MEPVAPSPLPIQAIDWQALIPHIGPANRALARYDGVLSGLQNPGILLSPLTTQEAVLSSRIEGTQATFGEALLFDAGQEVETPSLRLDLQEIVNYRRALRDAQQDLQRRPFSLNLLRTMHATLLDSARGASKGRGEFRRVQNWIGRPGTSIEVADFVPPAPGALPGHLGAWETYYHADAPDPLVQLAVVHAQFEVLHPFLDGNGRLGRILIPLFLFEKKLLPQPVFYLSSYLDEHREAYISRLRAVTEEPSGWQAWCEFFLAAVAAQADRNTAKARRILDLYQTMKARVIELTHSQHAVLLLDAIFAHPIASSTQISRLPNMPSRATLLTMLRRLRDGGVLEVIQAASGRAPLITVCPELMRICEEP